jgi:hypothetical protein
LSYHKSLVPFLTYGTWLANRINSIPKPSEQCGFVFLGALSGSYFTAFQGAKCADWGGLGFPPFWRWPIFIFWVHWGVSRGLWLGQSTVFPERALGAVPPNSPFSGGVLQLDILHYDEEEIGFGIYVWYFCIWM